MTEYVIDIPPCMFPHQVRKVSASSKKTRLVTSVFGIRHGGLMVSALVSGSSGPGSSPGRGHCVVFLGKTLYSHSASLHPGI